jgi:hypothetical protein
MLYVARRITFTVPTKDDAPRIIAPPAAVMKLIPSVVLPQLPPLDGIVTTPYLDHGGELVTAEGYNPGTRLVLHMGDLQVPEISDKPGAEELAQAVKLITVEWLGDFPFRSDADKANAIAVLLTLTGRMFFKLVPLTVLDASSAGSGKGLLTATISLIATGQPPEVMELENRPRDDARDPPDPRNHGDVGSRSPAPITLVFVQLQSNAVTNGCHTSLDRFS